MSDKEQEGKPPRLSAGLAQFLDDSPPKVDALQTFDDLDDLLLHGELSDNPSGAVGRALFDELFGARNLYGQLHGLSHRRSEFERKLQGPWPVRDIADFAVTSGHEAVCRFAERISRFAWCRKSSIPRLDEELAAARLANNAERIAIKEAALDHAGIDFAKSIQSASKGWMEHRAWIRRSIVNEIETMKMTTTTETTEAGDQDIAIHTLEGLRTFLGLGGKHWDNRPDWPDAAAREAMLPDDLRRPLQERRAATEVASQARHEHELALQGKTTGARGKRFRAACEANPGNADALLAGITLELANASKEADLAETLALANLRKVEVEVSRAQNEVELKLTTDWIARHRPHLEALNARFVAWFDSKRRQLDGLGVDRRQKFAGRVRNSACEVLRDMTHDALQTITPDSRVPEATFKSMDLGHEEWDALAQAVRNEVAVVESTDQARGPVQGTSKAEAAPTGDYGGVVVARRHLHDAVTSISGCLSDIRTLIGRYPNTMTALVVLDHHVQFPEADPEPDHPDRTPTWRAVMQAIRAHIATARELWEARFEDIDGYLRLELARTSRGSVRCGPFERNTHHELVIAIARLIVDPLDEGAIWKNEQGSLGVEILGADTVPRLARLRVIEDMGARPWWQDVALGLEREYAKAVHHPSVAALESHLVQLPVATVNMLVQDGKTWRIRFDGVEQSLPDRRGLTYLQKLLAEPGRAIHVADLLGQPVLVTSKDPIADPEARRDLRRAFEDARMQLTEAEDNNDEGTMLAATEELNELHRAIQRASSPMGTTQISSETNRVRAAVGKAIERALTEIKAVHPDAHAHLVKYLTAPTGFNPTYDPPATIAWQVNLAANGSKDESHRRV